MKSDKRAFLECAYSDKQIQYERHFHNAYELVYICEGTVQFKIGESCYDAGPHTALLISKLEEHNLRIIDGYYRRYYILLTPLQLDRNIKDPKLRSVFISRPKDFLHAFDLSAVSGNAEALMETIHTEYVNSEAYAQHASSNLFELFMILCYRAKKEQFPLSSKKLKNEIYEIQSYLDRHFTQKISLEDLAERFYISSSYLSRTFHEWTGSSPKQYIMKSRIAYAKELLITTNLSVSEVAIRSGFGDTSNFIRSFKKETHETPMQYRFSKH